MALRSGKGGAGICSFTTQSTGERVSLLLLDWYRHYRRALPKERPGDIALSARARRPCRNGGDSATR